MATMIVELYDALKAAGAPEDKAQAAAKVLASGDVRFDRIDGEFAGVRSDLGTMKVDLDALKVRLARVEAELGMVKWIVSGVGFGVLLLVLRSFWPGA